MWPAARTEASALWANVFAVDTDFRRQELLSALNAVCQDVYCYAYAEVPVSFSPRRAKGRWYQYHLPYRDQDVELMRRGAAEFVGEHEFRLFCKPDGKVTKRLLDSVEVRLDGGMIVIDLKAREFLRNMVRRIVSALDQVGRGRVSLDEVRSALQGEGRSMGLAEPEGLFLMDVDHGIDLIYGPVGADAREGGTGEGRCVGKVALPGTFTGKNTSGHELFEIMIFNHHGSMLKPL